MLMKDSTTVDVYAKALFGSVSRLQPSRITSTSWAIKEVENYSVETFFFDECFVSAQNPFIDISA